MADRNALPPLEVLAQAARESTPSLGTFLPQLVAEFLHRLNSHETDPNST
jgi:hypothetical protein